MGVKTYMKKIKKILLFILIFIILVTRTSARSKPVFRTIKTEVRPYSWSRKSHSYYEIKNALWINQQFNEKGHIKAIVSYTKGNQLYEKAQCIYDKGRLKEIKIYDRANNLLTRSVFKKQDNGLNEDVYNNSSQLVWSYLYLYDPYGRLKEKRKYNPNKKIILKYTYSYDKSGLLYARILYNADNTPIYMSQYEYETVDQYGNWKLRREYQSYGDVYNNPKEVVERTITYGTKLLNQIKQRRGEQNSSDYFKSPSFSVNTFITMTEQLSKANTPGGKVLKKALAKIKAKTIIKGSCYDWINLIYKEAGYSSRADRQTIFWGKENGPYANPMLLQPGDWIMFKNQTYGEIGHSGIFLGWLDFERRSAIVIGYAGQNRSMPGRFREYDITRLFSIIRGRDLKKP